MAEIGERRRRKGGGGGRREGGLDATVERLEEGGEAFFSDVGVAKVQASVFMVGKEIKR